MDRMAIVFIHGIGVQDRYQQLTSFADGIRDSTSVARGLDMPEGAPRHRFTSVEEQDQFGRFLQLVAEGDGRKKTVEVHEVFWGPLLNGLTSPLAVLRWMVATIVRAPMSLIAQRRSDGLGRWFVQAILVFALVAGGVISVWWMFGAFALSADRLLLETDPIHRQGIAVSSPKAILARNQLGMEPHIRYIRLKGLPGERGTSGAAPDLGSPSRVERADETSKFVKMSLTYPIERLYTQGFSISLPTLFERLQTVQPRQLVLSLLYAIVAFLGLRAMFGTIASIASHDQMRTLRKGLALVFYTGLFFLLDGQFDLLLAELFMSAAIFLATYVSMKAFLTEILGDVEIYTVRNENSAKYDGKEKVLRRAIETIDGIIRSDRYSEVVIVGHSLGSVVGLEALRRMYTDYSLETPDLDKPRPYEKIKTFVTIGSPLQKTKYFLEKRDHKSRFAEFSQAIDRRIFVRSKQEAFQHHVRWFNYYFTADLVADPLDDYPISNRGEECLGFGKPVYWPHSSYWYSSDFSDALVAVVLGDEPPPPVIHSPFEQARQAVMP